MGVTQDSSELHSLVVVGSSAGGVEALSLLVATLPADFPAPLVLAQHLDPRQPSHLGEILARRSTLPVRTVTDQEHLDPGVVYVVPADRHVEIADHMVRLHDNSGKHPMPSIDRLLSSAASVYGERLIAVILTGTGSDGASGAHAVKAGGGMVIIENPATAAYPGMPESLTPGTVDLVADLERIGPLLYDLVTGVHVPAEPAVEAPLQAVLALVRDRSGIDFSRYKRPTILRRLQRRMAATGVLNLTDYTQYLARHSAEYARLVSSFLITVTEFFRDPELFAALRTIVLPELLTQVRARQGNDVRIWSAGCATGEEAYSLAMLVAEALGEDADQFIVQIFATDLDEEAVAFARRGVYPAASLKNVPQEMRSRYFASLDGASFEVIPRIRNLVIFGQHDLAQRAPFPHIDLVLCRNVLMYFTPELQHRALRLFAFALRDGGYLALGKAETAKPLEAYFAPADEHVKLYRRRGERVLPVIERAPKYALRPLADGNTSLGILSRSQPLAHSDTETGTHAVAHTDTIASAAPIGTLRNDAGADLTHSRSASARLDNLLFDTAVGVVVVDRQYDIQAINSGAREMLGIFDDAVGKDLIHLASYVPGAVLRATIDAAFVSRSRTERDGGDTIATVETIQSESRRLQIACYPRSDGGRQTASTGTASGVAQVVILVSDVTRMVREQQVRAEATTRERADRQLAQTHEQGELAQAYLAKLEENVRLRAQVDEVSAMNRTLLRANRELVESNMDLRGENEELLVGREEAEASAEEIKTLNEEMQATNEELVTVNEELEATVEELHTANDDLASRGRELQLLAATLERQRQSSESARAQLEAILLSMGDALMVVDATGALALTNAAYAQLFGRADAIVVAEDASGHPLTPKEQPQRRATANVPFTLAFTLTAPDGTRRWFEASGQPVVSGDGAHGGVVTIRDITERSIRLLQDEFLALASDELRSPLTALLMALQLLGRRPPSTPDDPDFQTALRLALRQGQRLRMLVNDLLDIGRVQQQKLLLKLVPVDLVKLVRETTEAAQLEAQGQRLVINGGTESLVMDGDATRLEQIVLNLLTNVITYAPGTERIEVRLTRVGKMAELQVRDFGPGIDSAELPHIFDRYFQSASVSTHAQPSDHRGLGLGLFITKELVAAHGGTISVTSAIGEGATFMVRLPLHVRPQSRRRRAELAERVETRSGIAGA